MCGHCRHPYFTIFSFTRGFVFFLTRTLTRRNMTTGATVEFDLSIRTASRSCSTQPTVTSSPAACACLTSMRPEPWRWSRAQVGSRVGFGSLNRCRVIEGFRDRRASVFRAWRRSGYLACSLQKSRKRRVKMHIEQRVLNHAHVAVKKKKMRAHTHPHKQTAPSP